VNDPTTTRRSVLRRALGLAAGAVGTGVATSSASGAASHAQVTTLLTARHVETRGSEERRYAVLLDGQGSTVGHLHGAELALASPFGVGDAASSIELHSVSLPGGTLFAQGAFHGSTGTFHIAGGTGRFAGAHGSYRYELASGAAQLALNIVTREDS
jgi:hypothetical protein